jgi:hypothetical protein
MEDSRYGKAKHSFEFVLAILQCPLLDMAKD